MKIKLFFLSVILLITSCAKLPTHTVTLVDVIAAEGKRMHQLNNSLINKMFNEKREMVDEFIRNDYSPKYIEEYTKKIPTGINLNNELPAIMKSVIPKINERRDAMQNSLETNRIKVIDKLNQDYREYEIACAALKNLIVSAIKVDEERKKLLQKTQELLGNKIDFDQLEIEIDKFIIDGGDGAQNLINLNESVNKILNK